MKRIAVIFPGIGYTCDKPLLYYAQKIAVANGYDIKQVNYGGFSSGIKGNRRKMEEAFYSALTQAEEILKDINWEEYDEILFISKSVGTIVAACYMKKHRINGRSISFTPLEDTFLFAQGEGIMFHGTADPWAQNSEEIQEGCEKIGQKIHLVEGANHSLETGDVIRDIENLKNVMEIVKEFVIVLAQKSA